MNKLLSLVLVIIVPLAVFASEANKGTLTVLLFSDGKPLVENEVKIDGRKIYKSDKDGAVNLSIREGKHQLEIFGKSASGEYLGYFKKTVVIKFNRNTEIIATFSKKGADSIDIDTPVAVAALKERKEETATGTGTLKGTVLSSEGNTPIAGARIFVRGTTVDVRTDEYGRFVAKIPSGKTVSISVVHSAYSAQTISGISVKKNGIVNKVMKLTPASMELEEFVVLAPKVEGSLTDIIAEEKNSNAIANILGSEEFSKKGDSTAAAALRRVTGVTLVGRNIYVRGLGERYSNVEMNGLPLPSPNPLKRTVPLDVFPSSVIGSMKIQKSASGDIPSSFGGGYIDVRTKERFDEDFIKITLAGQINSDTGDEHIDYVGSGSDWTGYDRSYRDVPEPIRAASEVHVGERVPSFTTRDYTEEQLSEFTSMYINRIYGVHLDTLKPGFGGSIEGAKNFDIDDDHHITVYGNYGYVQKNDYVPEEFYGYDYDIDGNLEPTATKFGTIDQTSMKIAHGGMLNIGYNYADILRLKYSKLYTKNSVKTTRITDGIIGSNYSHYTYYNLNWEEREMNVDQISGDFDYKIFNLNSNLEFGLEHATAEFYQPNNYQYAYLTEGGLTFNDNSLSNHLANRLESNDDLDAFYLKNRHEIEVFANDEYIEYGINISSKTRVSRQNKYYLDKQRDDLVSDRDLVQEIDGIYNSYVLPLYPYDYRIFLVSPLFKAADYFDGYVDETSPYVSWMSRPTDDIEVVLGLRYVSLEQSIDQYVEDRDNPDPTLRRLITLDTQSLTIDEFFPSISVKYKHSENQYFDFAASKTYIMPDMREFSQGVYFHPFDVATIEGNPDLVNTIIYNLDFKYSYFFSPSENVKLGAYYKYMENPIEDVQLPTSSLPRYSYMNSESATLFGLEIDGRKNFDFINTKWSNYYMSGNFSYNFSEVTLSEEQKDIFTSDARDLQGLSPFVLNFTLGYETDTRSVLLNMNYMDERIRKVGVIDADNKGPDQYEVPPTLLDFVWTEKFTYEYDFEFRVKAGNLLDEETIWKLGEGDGLVTRRFKTGRTLGMKISAKF